MQDSYAAQLTSGCHLRSMVDHFFYRADYCCLGLPMSAECAGLVLECGAETGPCAVRGHHGMELANQCAVRQRGQLQGNSSNASSGRPFW